MLDPWLGSLLKSLYNVLPIPKWFPPEGIVGVGHLLAIAGAVGFAYSTTTWWGGWVAGLGVFGNHTADCIDGTHARRTNQCRNGGELLDHSTDPLSFAYWLCGLAVSCDQLGLGLAAVICLFASAVLTNIKAKMIGEFTLNRFGPTEFKSLLVVYSWSMAGLSAMRQDGYDRVFAAGAFLALLVLIGLVHLPVNLVRSVIEVNARGSDPDTSEWITGRPSDDMT